ncbi:MAG: phage integrase family protein [Solimicrobium sp.]|jgi:hypothetical protein|nr:phage integrase family protein [Solimicrobium sp.]
MPLALVLFLVKPDNSEHLAWTGITGAALHPYLSYFSKLSAKPICRINNPHSFKNTLVQLGQKIGEAPKQFKAWGQNIGHENVITTFTSYREIGRQRQANVGNELEIPSKNQEINEKKIAGALARL